METIDLPDWESFLAHIQTIKSGLRNPSCHLLFRGQPDSEHKLTTTLERAGCEGMSFDKFYQLVSRTRPAVETFTGVKWDVPDYSGDIAHEFHQKDLFHSMPYRFPSVELYRYLVYLRHHGFPSPLLDWSRSPFIAAFFAFRDLATRPFDGKPAKRSIYIYTDMPQGTKGFVVGESAMRPIGPFVRSHPRHFRQQSDYTICGDFDKNVGWKFHPHELVAGSRGDRQDVVWKFNLPSTEWRKILAGMNEHSLNAFSLFDSAETLLETMWFQHHAMNVSA